MDRMSDSIWLVSFLRALDSSEWCGLGSRPRPGMDEPRDRVRVDGRCGPCGRVPHMGAPRSGADASTALLPQPDLCPDERRIVCDVLRDVRCGLPACPVLSSSPRRLTADVRSEDPSVDGNAGRGGALAGALSDRVFPGPRIVAVGLALQSIGLFWLAFVTTANVDYLDLVIPFVLSGMGMGLFFAPVANVIMSSVRPIEEGQASGTNNAIRELGGVFGVAVLASVFASRGGYESPDIFSTGLKAATTVGAIVVALGALIAFAVPTSPMSAGNPEPVAEVS